MIKSSENGPSEVKWSNYCTNLNSFRGGKMWFPFITNYIFFLFFCRDHVIIHIFVELFEENMTCRSNYSSRHLMQQFCVFFWLENVCRTMQTKVHLKKKDLRGIKWIDKVLLSSVLELLFKNKKRGSLFSLSDKINKKRHHNSVFI